MNKLEHLTAFQSALTNYRLSASAKQILHDTKLVLLTAATASGRNTIINELLKTDEYYFIVSDTTRQPRVNNGVPEQDGIEYWFRREEDVLADVQAGSYLEAEVIHGQQVSGISTRELKKATDEHKIAITDVDIGGAEGVAKLKPDTIAILVLPPSFEEWQRRIHSRGEMPSDEFRRRMETAARIFATGIEQDFLIPVINDKLEDAVADVHQLATTGNYDVSKKQLARGLLEELYSKTKKFLEQ